MSIAQVLSRARVGIDAPLVTVVADGQLVVTFLGYQSSVVKKT